MPLSKYQPLPHETVTWHPGMPELLFRYRRAVSQQFRDVLGTYQIDHIAIHIVNPNDMMLSFSSTPTMLYHLITRGLWKYDGTLSPAYFKKLSFFLWQNTYSSPYKPLLKQLKENDHGMYHGFTLVRHIYSFYLLYSFATKQAAAIWQPYQTHINELLKIGDYCYKSIKKIAAPLCKPYVLPSINRFVPYEPGEPQDVGQQITNRHLNLMIDHEP